METKMGSRGGKKEGKRKQKMGRGRAGARLEERRGGGGGGGTQQEEQEEAEEDHGRLEHI